MHPGISVTFYLISMFLLMLLINLCLRDAVPDKSLGRCIKAIYIPVYFLAGLSPVAGALMPDSGIKYFFQKWGNVWLGFYIYFLGFMYIFMFLWMIALMIRKKNIGGRPAILALSFILSVGLLIYGSIHAQNTTVVTYDVNIDKHAGDLKEMKLILIADLHMSVNSKHETIQKMVDMINEEDADVVVVAGDIFTSDYKGMDDPERYAGILRGIRSKYGVYAVYGNHDVQETLFGGFPITPISRAFRTAEMEKFFEDAGFKILYDETVLLGGEIQLVGRVDGEKAGDGTANRTSAEELLKDVDHDKPVLILEHEPVDFANLKEYGADLALCGHTHNGQIFPGNLIVPFFNENAYGYKVVSGLQTIVTAGIGYYGPPLRVGTNSEITIVNLTFD